MNDELRTQVRTIQALMMEPATLCFSRSEQDHLRCLIRVTMEFYDYLQNGLPTFQGSTGHHYDAEAEALRYSIHTIFSAVGSFLAVNAAYRVLDGEAKSEMDWGIGSAGQLKEKFVLMYDKFIHERIFESKCRLLLDLFRIQLVFAGMFYE